MRMIFFAKVRVPGAQYFNEGVKILEQILPEIQYKIAPVG